MISYESVRHDGSYSHKPVIREMTQGQALCSLVQFEFGFGGYAIDVSATHIVVQTPVLGKVDITTFTGTEAEMPPLIIACGLMSDIRRSEQGRRTAVESLRILADDNGCYRPFDVIHFGPQLASFGYIKPVALAAAGIEPTAELCALRTDDVMAAIELAMDAGWNGWVYDLLAA